MKSVDYKVSFYSNTLDNTHCFQAALKMVLKYFWPDRDFSWEELEKITAKRKNYGTWPLAGMIWLKNNGFSIKDIEPFDYDEFIRSSESYLLKFFGKEVGEWQIKESDLPQEVEYAKQFIDEIQVEKRIPSIDDIKNLLKEGYLIGINVNSQALNSRLGYAGHFVIIKGFDNDKLILHDPGLPPQENREVGLDTFEKAWAYPDEQAKNIMAFKFTGSKE